MSVAFGEIGAITFPPRMMRHKYCSLQRRSNSSWSLGSGYKQSSNPWNLYRNCQLNATNGQPSSPNCSMCVITTSDACIVTIKISLDA
jgi:hypothetical protein